MPKAKKKEERIPKDALCKQCKREYNHHKSGDHACIMFNSARRGFYVFHNDQFFENTFKVKRNKSDMKAGLTQQQAYLLRVQYNTVVDWMV